MKTFHQFEKIDRKIEQGLQEAESMTKRAWLEKLTQNSFAFAVVWSLVLNLIIETLGRFSTTDLLGGIRFAVEEPLIFCYNALLIFATLLITSVFKRRVFTFIIISVFWLAIGSINGVLLVIFTRKEKFCKRCSRAATGSGSTFTKARLIKRPASEISGINKTTASVKREMES